MPTAMNGNPALPAGGCAAGAGLDADEAAGAQLDRLARR